MAHRRPCRANGSTRCSMACARIPPRSIMTRSRGWRRRHKPKLIIAGGSAYPRIIDFARFRKIADSVGALFMVDMAHFAGLVAAGSSSQPAAARRYRHHHHAQDAARSARRHDPFQQRGYRQEDQFGRFPGPAGRAADAYYRGQGGGLRRGADSRNSRLTARRSPTTPRRWPPRWSRAGWTSCPAAPTPI